LIWRKRAMFQETEGDETAFVFEPDGTVVGVGWRIGTAQSQSRFASRQILQIREVLVTADCFLVPL